MRRSVYLGLAALLGLLLLAAVPNTGQCGNLLMNAGFDAWTNIWGLNGATGVSQGWSYIFPDVQSYAYGEATSSYGHEVRTGANAVRLQTNGFPYALNYGTIRLWQEPLVTGGTSYTASVYVKTVDNSWDNTGFGGYSEDSVYLRIEEFDASGASSATPRVVELKTANEAYQKLQIGPWTAAGNTVKMRYTLGFKGGSSYMLGWATADDAVLDGAGPPPPTVTLTGTITSGGQPLAGATIAATDVGSATSGPDGKYTISTPYTGADYRIRITKPGYYAQTYLRSMLNPTTVVNADLAPENLLVMGGFDDSYVSDEVYIWNHWIREYDPTDSSSQWATERDLLVYHGTVVTRDGDDALTMLVYPGYGLGARVYQDVQAPGGQVYAAKTWFRPGLLPGKIGPEWTMWGDSLEDDQKAGLFVEEYNSADELVVAHPVVYASEDIYNWEQLACVFAANPSTTRIRFSVYARQIENWFTEAAARAVFDSCELSVAPVVDSISAVKKMPLGSAFVLNDKVVTAAFDGYFYIEESNRSSGIRVQGAASPGDIVDVLGYLTEIDGEPALKGTINASAGGTIPRTLGMGGHVTTSGLDVVGLYVMTWGRILEVDADYFTISDGGTAIKVYAPAYFATVNDYVTIVGVIGAETAGDQVVPVIRGVTVEKIL